MFRKTHDKSLLSTVEKQKNDKSAQISVNLFKPVYKIEN